MIILMTCTRKYEISQERGWKLFFEAGDTSGIEGQADIEANVGFVVVVPANIAQDYVEGETYGLATI
jgi:hypothetical protein